MAEALVRDVGHIVSAHAFWADRRIQILTAQLQTTDTTRCKTLIVLQDLPTLLVLGEEIRIRILVQVAADNRLRLIPLGDLHGFDAAFGADKGIEANEIDVVGAEPQGLRHNRVVVLGFGEVAIGAGLRFLRAHGVGEMGIDRLG